jgi:hypothetical protein
VEERGFSKCLNPTAWVRALCCNSVYITHYHSMRIPVSICTSYFMADKRALVDSGATDNFMHPNFATKMGLGMKELPMPRKYSTLTIPPINQGRSCITLIWMYTLKEFTRKCDSLSQISEAKIYF